MARCFLKIEKKQEIMQEGPFEKMMKRKRDVIKNIIEDNDTQSHVTLREGWLSSQACTTLFENLEKHLLSSMSHDEGTMYGKAWKSKRLIGTVSTAPGVSYSYSSVQRHSLKITFQDLPWLEDLRVQMEQLCGHVLNFCFINFYRPSTPDHPDDQLGWHSDDEQDMVPGASIVSLSVGDTRTFAFRKKGETKQHCATSLNNGDVAIMSGKTQTYYQHAITTKGVKLSKKGRWNLTFRQFRVAP
jgi:alkylated DNA repair dioxygenase AlkB